MTELELVAIAICKSRTCEGVSCCQWPAQGGRTQCPVKAGAYDDAARAAISAIGTFRAVFAPVEAPECLRRALATLVEESVNPGDGGPYEDGEWPALDAARRALGIPTFAEASFKEEHGGLKPPSIASDLPSTAAELKGD